MLGSYVKRLAIGSSAKAIQSVIQVRKLGINRIDKFIKESIATPGVPFVENYRSAWPDISDNTTDETLAHLNSRTIPDSALKFEMKTTFVRGSRIFYSHLNYHPADFKVIMRVSCYQRSDM